MRCAQGRARPPRIFLWRTSRLYTFSRHALPTAPPLPPPRAIGYADDTLVATRHAPYNPHNHH